MSHPMSDMSDISFKGLHPRLKLPLLNFRLETRYTLCLRQAQNLYQLEAQAAKYGPLDVPIALQNQIEETKLTIKQLEDEIEQMEHLIVQIKERIEREERKQIVTPPIHRFGTFLEWPPFNQYARDAREIFITGGSLDNLIQLYGNFLVEKATDGCEIRLVLMDPESLAIPYVELWSDPNLPKDYYRRAICRSLRHLATIDIQRKLNIRLDPSIPALTVMILNGSQQDGRIRVDIQPFQAVVIDRPVFEVTRQDEDLKWYDMFYRQYSEKLWSVAKPVDLSNLPSECL